MLIAAPAKENVCIFSKILVKVSYETIMPNRLAITIAGAVSLGSYESGVLYEVLDAIDQHNSDPKTAEEDRIAIDVLTGASAGGMTATILAQKLLFSGPEFKGPYDNPLYNTWIKRIDMQGLQDTKPSEPALHSLFSSDLISDIARETLLARYDKASKQDPEPHTSVGRSIKLGVALTNLNGVDYGYPVTPNGKFIYIRYGDQMTRTITSPDDDRREVWRPLTQAAVACGAFPIAFRTQDVERSTLDAAQDYPPGNLEPWPQDPTIFTYSDGGILQNQPLGIAKNLVDEIDCHLHSDTRSYLFISPNAKDATANDNFHEQNADYVQLLKRLFSVVIGQSEFHDWITAEDVNKKIDLMDERANQLINIILKGEIETRSLQSTADSLLALLYPATADHPNGAHCSPGARKLESLGDAKIRIAKQYHAEMSTPGLTAEQAAAFQDSILAFEAVAGLGARDKMEIYGVTATDSELAGAGLSAFLGFFDRIYRDHDYDVGRTHARTCFELGAQQKPHGICALLRKTKGKPINPIEHRFDGLKLKDVPNKDLNQFKHGLKLRVNQMLKELIGGWSILVDPIADQIVVLAINQLIAKL